MGSKNATISGNNILVQDRGRAVFFKRRWANEVDILIPARTGGSGTAVDPGNVDTADWMGAGVGKPFVFDNVAVDSYYYLFFTSWKYYTATGDWGNNEWHQTIGVARSTTLNGTYTVLNGDAPILEPSSDNALWYYFHLLGSSIYANPNAGDDELFAFQSTPLTVEMLLHLTGYPTGAGENTLIERRDSSGNVVWGLYLYHSGAGSRHVRAKVTVGGVTSATPTLDTYTQPGKDEDIILGLSYHPTVGFLSVYLSESQVGANKIKTLYIPVPGAPDSSNGGDTTVLNNQGGSSFDAFVHLKGLRILSEYSFSSNFSGRATTVIGAGAFASIDNTVFFANFADADDRYHHDGNLGDGGAEIIGVTWVAATGLLADGSNERIELHNPPVSQYVMLLSGLDLGGILGLAFSDSLNENWALYPLPSVDLSSGNSPIADPYITGANKKLNGILFPSLYEKAGTTYLSYGEETTDTHWVIRQRELDSLFYPQASVLTIREGTYTEELGDTDDFDNLGVSAPFVISKDFTRPDGENTETLFYEGDSVITGDRTLAAGGTEGVTVHQHNIGYTGVDV
ncbi:hypothetical protein LCGC14_0622170 [marine sediment metagenome]|uniref:Uncharacterized protein n=1 Tax=marine sediment metagenome TaxID=412755 RepID=A0A0F9TQU5_9ZZZZ